MIVTSFSPPPGTRPNPIGHSLSRRYPVECRTPDALVQLLKRLERRAAGGP